MAIPTRPEMRIPLLQHFADGEEHYWETVKENLANRFALTEADRQLLDRLGNNLFNSKLYTVLKQLQAEGMVERIRQPGYYKITERGQYVLKQPPETINSAFWQRFKLPSVDAVIPVFLRYLGDREARHYLLIRNFLTDHFSITPAQRKAAGGSLYWHGRCRGAHRALSRSCCVESASPGHYRITDLGAEVLQDPPEVIDTAFLETFSFSRYREIDLHVLQHIADKGPKSRESFIDELVTRLRTDTYPSSEKVWIQNCKWAMKRLEQNGLVTSIGEKSRCQITSLGHAALVLVPSSTFPFGFIERLQKAAVLLQ